MTDKNLHDEDELKELDRIALARETMEQSREPDDDPNQFLEDELHKLLVDLGGESDTEMRIYRQPGNGRSKLSYIFACNPGDYTYGELLEKVKREYGGGEYRMHVRQDKRLIINRQFSVSAQKESTQNNQSMELMQERFENKMEKMQSDNMRMFERFVDTMGNQQKGPSPLEMQQSMMAMMLQVKELFAENKKESNPIKDLKELMVFQNDLRDSMPQEREPNQSDILLNAISQFGPAFKDLISAKNANQPAAVPAPQPDAVPVPQPGAANGAQPTAQSSQLDNAEIALMKPFMQHLQVLLLAAGQDADPITYANVIVDFADNDALKNLHVFLTPNDSIEKIPANFPQVKQYFDNPAIVKWFEELRIELLSILDESLAGNEPEPQPETENDGGLHVPVEPAISDNEPTSAETAENDHGHTGEHP